MNVLKWKQGNKENLIAELAKIETEEIDNESYISLNTFREYTAMNKREQTKLRWWQCCDGDPEERLPKGTLIDYFFAVAQAQKVKTNPLAFLFPLFGVLLIYLQTKSSKALTDLLNFNV